MAHKIDGKIAILISGPIRYVSLVSKRVDAVFKDYDYDCFYHLWKDDLGNKIRQDEVADYREIENHPRTKALIIQEPYSEQDFADSIGVETGSHSSINATMGMFFSVNLLCHYLRQLPDHGDYKYVLRLRTDCAIINDNFAELLDGSEKTLTFAKNYYNRNSEFCDHICFGNVESFFRLWCFDGMTAIYDAYSRAQRHPESMLRNRFKTEMTDVRFLETISRFEDYHIIYSPPQKMDPETINDILNQKGVTDFFEKDYKLIDSDEIKKFIKRFRLKENKRDVNEGVLSWKADWLADKSTTEVSPASIGNNTPLPKFSIVMANYNNEKYLAQSIESVLQQDFKEWELIIVDDCSTDGSLKVIGRYLDDSRVKLIKQTTNRGKSAALKCAIADLRSGFFGVLDSDDMLTESAVSTMYQSHIDDPDCGLIYSQFAYCDENMNPQRRGFCAAIPADKTNFDVDKVSHFKTFKLCDYLKTEGYDETVFSAIDKDIAYKMEEVTKLKFVDKGLYLYRVLPLSLSRGQDNSFKAKQSMQRVRQAAMARRMQKMRSVPVGQNPTSNSEVVKCFNAAVEEYQIGNMVTARRLDAQYKKAMDYDQLNVVHHSSRKETPLLSVVMVTYNRPDDVRSCIETLRRQGHQDFEIVVVDNGDTDKKAIALAGQVDVYIDCPMNFNLSEGRNIGAHFANGQILVFLDDDALVGPEYLGSVRKAFEQYEILGLRGRAYPKNGGQPDKHIGIYDLGEQPFASLCNQEGNSAFRRDAYLAVGGMDPLLFGHEGSDLSYRLIQLSGSQSSVIYWPEAVIYHDYGDASRFAEKESRYQRNRNYLKYKYDVDVIGLKKEIQTASLKPNQSGRLLPPFPVMQSSAQTEQAAATPKVDGPKVSIIMSCHNAADFLAETMDTILAQTLKEWELLVTDDGSTDQTRNMLESYAAKDQRIRPWFFDDKKGPYVRRNFAIEQAQSPFICIQDADDLMAANKLEILYEEINRDEQLGIVGSFYRRFLDTFRGADFGDRMEKCITHSELMELFPRTWHVCWHGSAIIRKSLFDTIGPYDEQPYGSDTFWLSKAGLYGLLTGKVRFKNLPEFLTYKREHAQSQTGKISPVDPRSRRHRLERYYLQKLKQILNKAKVSPVMDADQKIRECTCTDFIPKFEHLFDQWESISVSDTMIQGLINRGLSQFSSELYVSALVTLNYLDQMVSGGCQSYRNLNLTRGLAYYASGDDQQAAANIQKEIQLFQSQNAQTFLTQYLTAGNTDSAADRRANIRRFIATAAQSGATKTGLMPPQEPLTHSSSNLQDKLAVAKQHLQRGQSEEASCIYQGLLSDNMLAGHIELKEKLTKLVEGIHSAKTSQVPSQGGFDFAASGNN